MRRALVPITLTLFGLAAPAAAHRFEHAKSLRLGVREDGRLVLAMAYDVNPGREARRTRAMFDRNADGALDEAERTRLLEAMEKICWSWLEIRQGERPVKWRQRDRAGHRLDRPTRDDSTLGVSLVYEAEGARAGAVRITIRDRDKDLAKHVPLVVDLAPGWHVKLASQGEWHPDARQIGGVALRPDQPLELVISRTSEDG